MVNNTIPSKKNQFLYQKFEQQVDTLISKNIPAPIKPLFDLDEFKIYAYEIIRQTGHMNFKMFFNEYCNALTGYKDALEKIKKNPLNFNGPFLMETLRKTDLKLLVAKTDELIIANSLKINWLQKSTYNIYEYKQSSPISEPHPLDTLVKKQIKFLEKSSSNPPIAELYSIGTYILSLISQVTVQGSKKRKWEAGEFYPDSIFESKNFGKIGQNFAENAQELYNALLDERIAEISKGGNEAQDYGENGQIIAQQIQIRFNAQINEQIEKFVKAGLEEQNLGTMGQEFANLIQEKIKTAYDYSDFAEKLYQSYQENAVSYDVYWRTILKMTHMAPTDVLKEINSSYEDSDQNVPIQSRLDKYLESVGGQLIHETPAEYVIRISNSTIFLSKEFSEV